MKKWTLALITALVLMIALTPLASASGIDLSGLESLLGKKQETAAEGGKAAQIASLTGGSQKIVVGVEINGLVLFEEDGKGSVSGYDVRLISSILEKANYRNYSFVIVEAGSGVKSLEDGEITLLAGVQLPEDAVSRVQVLENADSVAEADKALDMQAEAGDTKSDEEEVALAKSATKYLKTADYLWGKGEETLISGETVDFGGRSFYLTAMAENAKVVSAFDRAFAKVDSDGSLDSLWKEYFETGVFYNIWRAVRRTGLSIWRQFRMNLIEEARYQMILTGLGRTLLIAVCAAVLGVIFGCVLALMRLSNIRIGKWYVLRSISGIYVDIIRGTPVVVQLMIMYYLILVSPNISKVTVAIITFGLNSAAYVSEMVRGGILAVDKGQTEAGRSLGLSAGATMFLIVLPQTIKIIIPSLFNEIIMLLKETSVVGFIGLMDLTKAGDYIRSRTYSAFFPLLTVAVVYLIIVTVFTRVFNRIERRLRQGDLR